MESVSRPAEYVLDRSILERFPLFLERFLPLEKELYFSGMRS